MVKTRAGSNIGNRNSKIEDEFDNCTDDKTCIYETINNIGSIKDEPYDTGNEQGTIHNYVDIKDRIIDDLLVVAQKIELVADRTNDKRTIIDEVYIKQEPCHTENEWDSFHNHVNIKDEIIEDSTAIVVRQTGFTTNIKGNYPTRCEGCGEEYDLYCLKCPMLIHIFNSNNPQHNKVSRTLPKGFIDICKTPNGVGIVALKAIPKGVVFGPFEGLNSIKDDGVSKWKLKNEELAYIKDPKWLNWMQYVRRAGQGSLQNLTPFQYQDALYYRSDRHICAGDELLVYWDNESKENGSPDMEDSYLKPQFCERLDNTYACTFCCVGYKSKGHLEAHNSRCPEKRNRGDLCNVNIQCAFCKIYLDEKEYSDYHMDRCCKTNRVKYVATLSSPEDTDKPEMKDKYKCSLCEYGTSQKDKFERHQLTHSDLRMYKCPECAHQAHTNYKLQKHLLTHAKSRRNRFKCELCDERFTRWDFFAAHQKKEHSVSVYKCDKCVVETTNVHNLRRHLATHKDAKGYSCKTCGKQYQTKETLYEHVTNLHNEKKRKYKCPKFDLESFYWASLKHHLLAVHSGVKRFKCHRCAFKTSYKKIIERHLRYHVHHEVSESCKNEGHNGLKPFECTLCPYKGKTKYLLKQHKATHNNDRSSKCSVCPQTFKERYSLAKHTRHIHLEAGKREVKKKEYRCSKCKYHTHRKTYLNQHNARVHDGLKPFECTLCPHKAITNSQLKRHMAVHNDDKAFTCDMCPQMFKRKQELTKHVRNIHSDSEKKEYKCPQCPFETRYKKNLKCHIDTHNKSELFQCSECEFSTYNKRSLNKHQIRH